MSQYFKHSLNFIYGEKTKKFKNFVQLHLNQPIYPLKKRFIFLE